MNRKEIKAELELLSCPGDTILETIEKLGISKEQLAEKIGKNLQTVEDLISGRVAIDNDMAIRLQNALNIDSEFWMNKEHIFRRRLEVLFVLMALNRYERWRSISLTACSLALGVGSGYSVGRHWFLFCTFLVVEVGLCSYIINSNRLYKVAMDDMRNEIDKITFNDRKN